MVKPLEIAIFQANLHKKGVSMGHAQNKKQNFLQEYQSRPRAF